MSWRFYARRAIGGTWLDTDVPIRAEITRELNNPGSLVAAIPPGMDGPLLASDGKPTWWERGTLIYAEEDEALSWVGLLNFTRPTPQGRLIEFKGLSSLYDRVAFTGRIREWDRNPYGIVDDLLANAHLQPDANLGFEVVRDSPARENAGDPRPPDKPEKPKRERGETAAHQAQQIKTWEAAVRQWEKDYGDREPYSIGFWEEQYVGDEIRELAEECGFDVFERHAWTDRDNLAARHRLVLASQQRDVRQDVAIVEGENIVGDIVPETSLESYGNHVIALGAGEGRKMRRASYGRRDGRVRTTRYINAKAARGTKRLAQRAKAAHGRSDDATRLQEVQVLDATAALLKLGDDVRVESAPFTGWQRVVAVTRDTEGGPATVAFDDGDPA